MRSVAVDGERNGTNAAGPRRIERRKRRTRCYQKHDQAYEHEEGYDDRGCHRQNEVRFVQHRHGYGRIRHEKIIQPSSRWTLKRMPVPAGTGVTSFVVKYERSRMMWARTTRDTQA